MKNILKSIIAIALCFASFATTFANNGGELNDCAYENTFVYLPAGTTVSLELNETVQSENVEVGHVIDLAVYRNVVVNRKVVIRAGALAEGRVVSVNKACNACAACDGPCSEVVIRVENVQAVDGSYINLAGRPHKMQGTCCGRGPSVIELGVRLNARTRDNVKLYF